MHMSSRSIGIVDDGAHLRDWDYTKKNTKDSIH